jgi:hypothetical protein
MDDRIGVDPDPRFSWRVERQRDAGVASDVSELLVVALSDVNTSEAIGACPPNGQEYHDLYYMTGDFTNSWGGSGTFAAGWCLSSQGPYLDTHVRGISRSERPGEATSLKYARFAALMSWVHSFETAQ